MTRIRTAAVAGTLALALAASACSDSATPTAPSAPLGTTPVTSTFASHIGVMGAASRIFTAQAAGTVRVTLTSAGPPAGVVVGLGVGIPRADGTGCLVSRAVETAASSGPQLTIPVEAGNFCVRVYDIGRLTGETSFSITIVHP